jgi:membrane protein required for colicin V production
VLAVSALLGAASGALRQLVSLAAALAGALAARALARDVGEGLARTFPSSPRAAAAVAPLLLFFGIFAVASLVGGALLKGTGLAKVVRGPWDRAGGALLGGAKGALAAWVLLSAAALVRDHLPDRVAAWAAGSDFLALSRAHNLVVRLDPEAARKLVR